MPKTANIPPQSEITHEHTEAAEAEIREKQKKEYTTSDASNSRPKVIKRVEYVRDRLLGKA